jgi:hypothetical protein
MPMVSISVFMFYAKELIDKYLIYNEYLQKLHIKYLLIKWICEKILID